MIPVDALSLACSIFQVIDFSARILTTAKDIYDKSSLPQNDELKAVLVDLEKLLTPLRPSWTKDAHGMEGLRDRCLAIATEIGQDLSKLELKERSYPVTRRITALRSALQSALGGQQRIRHLEDRLRAVRDEME